MTKHNLGKERLVVFDSFFVFNLIISSITVHLHHIRSLEGSRVGTQAGAGVETEAEALKEPS